MTTVKQIWKYELNGQRSSIEMPEGAVVLTVQTQHNQPVLWAEVDPSAKRIKRRFLSISTGVDFVDDGPCHYVGTFQLNGGSLVFHVYTDRIEYPV